ncbi:MAG TPA: hypothetical protein VFT58_01255 [Nitrososphaera sp.]|nr:hypothetical protein [Nitrososphaera sp.]
MAARETTSKRPGKGVRTEGYFTPTRRVALATIALAGERQDFLGAAGGVIHFVARLTGVSNEQAHLDTLSMVGSDGEKRELQFQQNFMLALTDDEQANEIANAEVIPLDSEREIGRSVLADLVERTIELEQTMRAITGK